MEVSDKIGLESKEGQELIDVVVSLTGLPEFGVQKEISRIIEQSGQNSDNLTLDQLRAALVIDLERLQEQFMLEGVLTPETE